MGIPFIIGASQQKKKRILGFETYCAPDDFDRTAQPVDIYDIFDNYYKSHASARYISLVSDSAIASSMSRVATAYTYGYTSGGIDYISDLETTTVLSVSFTTGSKTSITVADTSSFPATGAFIIKSDNGIVYTINYTSKTPTSLIFASTNLNMTTAGAIIYCTTYTINWTGTKRWVIAKYFSDSPIVARADTNASWLYVGKFVKGVVTGNTTTNYVHINKLSDITEYPYTCSDLWENKTYQGLIGTLYISPSATKVLGTAAFRHNRYITNIVFPNSITELTSATFAYCYGLTTLSFPVNLLTIGENAFYTCNGLSGLITIPDSVQLIGNSAFYRCTFSSINFGSSTESSSLTTISASAFYQCPNITSVTFPTALTSIGASSFFECTSLTGSLKVTANITSIGESAFAKCNFTDIDVTANSSRYHNHDNVLYQESNHVALYSVKGYTGTLTLENDTLRIGNHCFYYNLRSGGLTLTSNIASIGQYAFSYANSLTGTLSFPSSVTNINDYAFYSCSSFSGDLVIEDTITTVGNWALCNVPNIKGTLTIGTGLSVISSGAFSSSGWTALVFKTTSNVVTIGSQGFDSCSNLTGTITIPDSVITIGPHSLRRNKITALVLGNNVATIQTYAFYQCVLLSGTLNIPASVTTLDAAYNVFQETYFTAITSSSTNYPAEDNVLYDCKTAGQIKAYVNANGYAGTLTFKAGTTSVLNGFAKRASPYTLRSGTLTILSTITSIGSDAFMYASGFTRVDSYKPTAPTVGTNGLLLGGTARPLHIPAGGTGYGIAPWTTATIFTQPPVADL